MEVNPTIVAAIPLIILVLRNIVPGLSDAPEWVTVLLNVIIGALTVLAGELGIPILESATVADGILGSLAGIGVYQASKATPVVGELVRKANRSSLASTGE